MDLRRKVASDQNLVVMCIYYAPIVSYRFSQAIPGFMEHTNEQMNEIWSYFPKATPKFDFDVCDLRVVYVLRGESLPQFDVMCALEYVMFKDLPLLYLVPFSIP